MGMFTHLFVPKPVVAGGDPRFSLIILFDKDAQASPEFKDLKTDVAAAIDAEFGPGKSRDAAFVKTLRMPFRDALEKKQYTGFTEGKVFIAPWTKEKPGVVDGRRQDITAPADVWAGQLVRATVSAFAYNQGANKGVNFMLSNVQVTKADMPRMDGRKTASEEFDDVDPPADDDDNDVPF